MQLISVPEPNIDIKVKMSTFDQTSVDEKFITNNTAEELKNGIPDNKIVTRIQESMIIDAEDSVAIDSDKENVDEAILVEDNIASPDKQDDEILCTDEDVKEDFIENVDTNTPNNYDKNDTITNDCNEKLDLKESQNDIVCLEEDKEDVNEADTCLKDDSVQQSKTIDVDVKSSEINNKSENCTIENVIDCDDVTEVTTSNTKDLSLDIVPSESKDEILDLDEIKEICEEKEKSNDQVTETPTHQTNENECIVSEKKKPTICKLSNNLEIFSDDEEDTSKEVTKNDETVKTVDKQCINIEDDDDIMLIEDTNSNQGKEENNKIRIETDNVDTVINSDITTSNQENCKEIENVENTVNIPPCNETELSTLEIKTGVEKEELNSDVNTETTAKIIEEQSDKYDIEKPLVPENFLSTCKKNLAEMTRDDLEEFCILKIVESIVDRSNLGEIKTKLKTMTQNIEEYKKKTMMLCKQNRDLQVVLKSVQEEQKKQMNTPITPLKITRSVGMQVLMTDKLGAPRKSISGQASGMNNNNTNSRTLRNSNNQSPRPPKSSNNSQQIPVPRLVPAANNPVNKTPNANSQVNSSNSQGKTNLVPNGLKNSPTGQGLKTAEKRSHNRIQSVTVDLTDDEPPSKLASRNGPVPPVRLVPSQNLLAPQRQQPFGQPLNSPRKVYIPISGPQGQNVRGQAIMLKSVTPQSPRQRGPPPHMVRMSQNTVRMPRVQSNRHPAPLPDCMKQYQHPNWKPLPPAPDLKLSKVENGIVISWKIDGYQEESFEEIASYQLYAYQETSSPPNTALWKKIGDVKALPLPMACTLTQFMAGYKYYFAVRAVDVKSRVGPFSVPGSILLLNKM